MMLPDLPIWATLLASLLLTLGGILTLIGTFGMLRFKHFFQRIHAPTLGATLGLGCVILACITILSVSAQHLALHVILISIFVVVGSPISSIVLMNAAIFREKYRE